MITIVDARLWHRLPRRSRRRLTDQLARQWGDPPLADIQLLYVIDGRVTGYEKYLRNSAGRFYLEGDRVATRRVGRSHG